MHTSTLVEGRFRGVAVKIGSSGIGVTVEDGLSLVDLDICPLSLLIILSNGNLIKMRKLPGLVVEVFITSDTTETS